VIKGKRKGCRYTTRLSAKIKSKEITDANALTRVSAFNVPSVVSPSSVWNIQKKLLFTCNANSAPEPTAKPSTTVGTSTLSNIGTSIPAAVMAATEIDPMERCKTAAINQASRIVNRSGVPASAEKIPQGFCQVRSRQSPLLKNPRGPSLAGSGRFR
jgi:hypothetical protein